MYRKTREPMNEVVRVDDKTKEVLRELRFDMRMETYGEVVREVLKFYAKEQGKTSIVQILFYKVAQSKKNHVHSSVILA